MVKISSNSELFDFCGGRSSLLEGLTIIERSWNYENLPYLVANTYGLNFIKIGGIWIFLGGTSPLVGWDCMWPAMPIFELGWAILVKSHVWKFGSDWLCLSRVIIWIFRGGGGGQKPPIRGVTRDLRCPFSNLAELFQSKVMCENLVWIGWNRRYIWPVMPIFETGRAFLDTSHLWKFGSHWLRFSIVFVVKKKKLQTQLNLISLQNFHSVRIIS